MDSGNMMILAERAINGIYNSHMGDQEKRRALESLRGQINTMLATLPAQAPWTQGLRESLFANQAEG